MAAGFALLASILLARWLRLTFAINCLSRAFANALESGTQRETPIQRSRATHALSGHVTRSEQRHWPRAFGAKSVVGGGIRYRLHCKNIPGRPDLVLRSRHAVVFVHGCFWHRHENCPRNRTPKSRVDWWTAKLTRNRDRDVEVRSLLEASGWRIFVIWECETERVECLDALVEELRYLSREK